MQDEYRTDLTDSFAQGRSRIYGQTIRQAVEAAAPARARLEAIYGSMPAVVYVIQRGDSGPVKIGWTIRLAGRITTLAPGSPAPARVRAAVPGNRAIEYWFHCRHEASRVTTEWFEDDEGVVADVRRFGTLHEGFMRETGDRDKATLLTVMEMDPVIADIYRLLKNGMTQTRIAEIGGMKIQTVRQRVSTMRNMGFDIAFARVYAARNKPREAAWSEWYGKPRQLG